MDDKILVEEDIVDLTDLLEEGNPPSRAPKENLKKKRVNEPDSFDLGKEISMEYDVSVEEIEQGSDTLGLEENLRSETKVETKTIEEDFSLEKEPLLDIEKEIDLAMNDKVEEVSLTSKEEEMLLKDELIEETLPLEEQAAPVELEELKEPDKIILPEEKVQETILLEPGTLPVKEEDTVSAETDIQTAPDEVVQEVEIAEPEPQAFEEITKPKENPVMETKTAASEFIGNIPTEIITDTLISEFKKEMPVLLENIMRPLVKELVQEIITATREALPSLVERVIREEIDKLKKL